MITDTGQRIDRHGEDRARSAVLEMTRTVLGEVGYQRLRVEAVAARAGVPRVWLHRWWTTRPLLVAEAVQRMGGPPDVVPSGDVRADLRAVVLRTATFLANPVVGDAMAGLTADAASDPVAAERLAALLGARRAGDVSVLLSAVARGDLRPGTDVALVLDVVYGALLFRLARGVAPTPAVVETLVDLLLQGNGAPGAGTADGQGFGGYTVDGDAPGGHALEAPGVDGHDVDGHAFDEHGLDGHGLDGHGLDGHGLDGHGLDGHGLDGHGLHGDRFGGVDGHRPGGHRSDGQGPGTAEPDAYRPDGDRDSSAADLDPQNGVGWRSPAQAGGTAG